MRDANMDACLEQLHAQTASAVALLQQYTEWEEGDRVLDVGCGCGEVTKYIGQQPTVASVLGIDLSPQLINYAETTNPSPKVSYSVADITDSSTIKPKWRNYFSKAVSFSVMHWICDKSRALNNIFSCLKPNGCFLFNCFSDSSSIVKTIRAVESDSRWRNLVKSREFTYTIYPWLENDVAGFRRFIEECGFDVEICRSRRQKVHIPREETFRVSVRPFMPHFDFIPTEFHEDVWKTAWQAVEACGRDGGKVWVTNCFEVRARKRQFTGKLVK
ncbi:PREDICTED: phosphoethanolamine N-methyltransferase 1-like [Branchiostoma belcheri]|uniref:Phosphoethanolamine N-methyltransferase 1-like n=1 Tax=Branchiostoma belcheri TaxID=7741 RepID=A0A6P5AT99_BRABE|nr:PREDICTED: phosphoethanolamine N-methyltransferase 1-like [Branchiostoma belcheri]